MAVLADEGITEPFAIQRMSIPDALAGRDVCGKAKTGSGKTLAFGLPLLQRLKRAKPRRPTALALVPTRELANQVHLALVSLAEVRGLRVSAIYGGASMDSQIRALAEGVDFVVATPGRMIDLIDRGEVHMTDIAHVVVDEADRMADMGFLPQVEWIMRQIDSPQQVLLYSATLDGAADVIRRRYQHDPVTHEVASRMVTVEEMQNRFFAVPEMDKAKVAAAIIDGVDRTLVFVRTRRGADRLTRTLRGEGVNAAAIHGDLRQNLREKALADFTNGKVRALVATDVAARGLDIDDVDIVLHYDPAEEHKTYLHRSGRTARAGDTGVAVTLVLWNEELVVRRMQRRIDVEQPIVEVFSNDERLADVARWDPVATDSLTASG